MMMTTTMAEIDYDDEHDDDEHDDDEHDDGSAPMIIDDA